MKMLKDSAPVFQDKVMHESKGIFRTPIIGYSFYNKSVKRSVLLGFDPKGSQIFTKSFSEFQQKKMLNYVAFHPLLLCDH